MLTDKKSQDPTSFAKLYEETLSQSIFSEGQIVKGTILSIRGDEAIIDIGYKSEGILSLDEFVKPSQVKPGDEVEVLFETLDDDKGVVVVF